MTMEGKKNFGNFLLVPVNSYDKARYIFLRPEMRMVNKIGDVKRSNGNMWNDGWLIGLETDASQSAVMVTSTAEYIFPRYFHPQKCVFWLQPKWFIVCLHFKWSWLVLICSWAELLVFGCFASITFLGKLKFCLFCTTKLQNLLGLFYSCPSFVLHEKFQIFFEMYFFLCLLSLFTQLPLNDMISLVWEIVWKYFSEDLYCTSMWYLFQNFSRTWYT